MFLLVLVIVIVPAAVTALTASASSESRTILEFVLGTWPNQAYTLTPAELAASPLFAVGVYLRTLAVMAVPVLLGIWVNHVTARIERRLHMQVTEYIHIREGYLENHVYLALADLLAKAGLKDEYSRQVVADAFAEGRREFDLVQAGAIREAIERLQVPGPTGQ